MALHTGEIIDGKYRIVRELGSGAMGAVYEGANVRIHRKVAIKVLLPGLAARADTVQRFEREAQAAGRIGSEHIVEVVDLGQLPDGGLYMVMEFLEGVTLGNRIHARGRLTPREIVPIAQQLLTGLESAHQARIVHRDLKPDNIFLCADLSGQKDFVKILDFGVSKFNPLDSEMSMTATGAVMGTPFYMSPEQAKGAKDIDGRSDLYSVGVILYEAITGQKPFHAGTFNELIFKIVLETPPPPEQFVPDLDPAFSRIVRRAMGREIGERFQSAKEFRDALSVWLHTGRDGKAVAPPAPPPASAPVADMDWEDEETGSTTDRELDARTMAYEPESATRMVGQSPFRMAASLMPGAGSNRGPTNPPPRRTPPPQNPQAAMAPQGQGYSGMTPGPMGQAPMGAMGQAPMGGMIPGPMMGQAPMMGQPMGAMPGQMAGAMAMGAPMMGTPMPGQVEGYPAAAQGYASQSQPSQEWAAEGWPAGVPGKKRNVVAIVAGLVIAVGVAAIISMLVVSRGNASVKSPVTAAAAESSQAQPAHDDAPPPPAETSEAASPSASAAASAAPATSASPSAKKAKPNVPVPVPQVPPPAKSAASAPSAKVAKSEPGGGSGDTKKKKSSRKIATEL